MTLITAYECASAISHGSKYKGLRACSIHRLAQNGQIARYQGPEGVLYDFDEVRDVLKSGAWHFA